MLENLLISINYFPYKEKEHKKIKQGFLLLRIIILSIFSTVLFTIETKAQTTEDVIMMNKKQWCNGLTYSYNSWSSYWEGTYKRTNDNIGIVSAQSVMFMSNYGIKNNLNVMVGLPWVSTKATAGTLQGLNGLQDISLAVKWKALTKKFAKGKISLFGVGELTTPTSNYVIDFLPLSIGLGSTNISAKLIANYQQKFLNIRLAGTYAWRSNVSLDRTAYYTTQIIYSNKVNMPNVANYNLAVGIHKKYLLVDAFVNNMTTLGGFDMRKNDMPFVSNTMNSTNIGVSSKYTLPSNTHISFVGAVSQVIAGRNVGQATSFTVGCFYANSFAHKVKSQSIK